MFQTGRCPLQLSTPLTNVTAFKGRDNVFSNFYPCTLHVFNRKFASSEHAYQFMKCKVTGNDDVAEEVAQTRDGLSAKRLVKQIQSTPDWEQKKIVVMKEIISAKLSDCPEYCQALQTSKDIIAEAVPFDKFWSAGLKAEDLMYVTPDKWPGQNKMGELHMQLRMEAFGR